MATIATKAAEVVGHWGFPGVTIETASGLEAASQSWKKGAFLYFVDGLLTVCAADSNVICGIALKDATGVTSARAAYIPATPGLMLEISLKGAADVTALLAQTTLGVRYGFQLTSAGYFVLDTSETTNGLGTVVKIELNTASGVIGDYDARVHWALGASAILAK